MRTNQPFSCVGTEQADNAAVGVTRAGRRNRALARHLKRDHIHASSLRGGDAYQFGAVVTHYNSRFRVAGDVDHDAVDVCARSSKRRRRGCSK